MAGCPGFREVFLRKALGDIPILGFLCAGFLEDAGIATTIAPKILKLYWFCKDFHVSASFGVF